MHCIFCQGLFSNLLFNDALAADHEAYEPTVCIDQEPNHHLVLMSSSIRVFDVAFSPGGISLWHLHNKDSVLVCLDGADVPSEELGKEMVPRPPISSGQMYYKEYAKKPFVHRIRNVSPTNFRILDIEILKVQATLVHLSTLDSSFEVSIDNDRVRVSKVIIRPGEEVAPIRFHGPHLLILMTDGYFTMAIPGQPKVTISAKRGHQHMEERAQTETISNIGDKNIEISIIEVK